MISIIVPSKNEIFLTRTIRDILEKATGEIEVLPILDGYEPPELVDDPRVRYLRLPSAQNTQKRHGVNMGVEHAKGEYIMSVDAHCMFEKGFDEVLVRDHQDNWVQIPRRHRLDAENWKLQDQVDDRPPVDYEYFMWPLRFTPKGLHGFKWSARSDERKDIMIDDALTFQGSCWFMTKEWFNKMGFMQTKGYTGWGQEAEEIGMQTRLMGGRVVVNKNTWYAHLHKGAFYGRMYWMSREENRRSYAYSYNKWVIENKEFFISLIEKFPPLPSWPTNWKELIYKET